MENQFIAVCHQIASYSENVWKALRVLPSDFGMAKFMTGNDSGPIIAGGLPPESGSGLSARKLIFTDSYSDKAWNSLGDAPSDILGLAGDVRNGILIYHDSNKISYVLDIKSVEWNTVGQDAPWPIKGLTGNNSNGPVVFGGEGADEDLLVAYLDDYDNPQWKMLAKAPFKIKGITGDNDKGVVIFGGSDGKEVAYMDNYGANVWTQLQNAPVEIKHISGDNDKGPIIGGGQNVCEFYYMRSSRYDENFWSKLEDAPQYVVDICGDNGSGPFIIGNLKDAGNP